jgi:phage recombination protein Bet
MAAPAEVTAIATRQQGLDDEQLALLKRTICEDATDDEYRMFVGICQRSGLDPFSKQIYFRKYNTQQGPRVAIITGIDGYRLIAQRTGEYEGQTEPEWCGADGVWKQVWLDQKPPAAARVGTWRRGFRQPLYAIAKWTEYYPSNPKERFMWDKMPANQISKCSEALSLRKAFPKEMSGLYVSEEMAQEGRMSRSPVEVEAVDVETNEHIRGALGDGPKGDGPTAASIKTTGSGPTTGTSDGPAAPPSGAATSPKANEVPWDTLLSPAQLQKIQILRRDVGGRFSGDEEDARTEWRSKVLCVYRDKDGNRIQSSKDLGKKQASHLIERLLEYQRKTKERHARMEAETRGPLAPTAATNGGSAAPDTNGGQTTTRTAGTTSATELEKLIADIDATGDEERLTAEICDALRVMQVGDLVTPDRVAAAFALAAAWRTNAYELVKARIIGRLDA